LAPVGQWYSDTSPFSIPFPNGYFVTGQTLRFRIRPDHRREEFPEERRRNSGLPGSRSAEEQGLQQEPRHVEHWCHHLCKSTLPVEIKTE